MLQISVLTYHQILAGFLHLQKYSECVNIDLLWNCSGDFTNFRVVAVTKKRILYMGKYFIYSGFSLCFFMKILLGNKTLVLISVSVSEIGPNVSSEHINCRMVEYVFCCMQFIIHPVAPKVENINTFIVQL